MSQTASLRKPSAPEKALTHEQIDPDEIRTLDEVSRAAALAYMRLELEAASEEATAAPPTQLRAAHAEPRTKDRLPEATPIVTFPLSPERPIGR